MNRYLRLACRGFPDYGLGWLYRRRRLGRRLGRGYGLHDGLDRLNYLLDRQDLLHRRLLDRLLLPYGLLLYGLLLYGLLL